MGAAMCGAIGMDAKANKKRVIIMDEVDGMGGNEDRGGVQELLSVIKKAKVPFICICNDRQHQKIRSLAGHCFDLRLRRPTKQVRGCDGGRDGCWSSRPLPSLSPLVAQTSPKTSHDRLFSFSPCPSLSTPPFYPLILSTHYHYHSLFV